MKLIKIIDGKRHVACVMNGNRADKEWVRGVKYMPLTATMIIEGHEVHIHDAVDGSGVVVSMYGLKVSEGVFGSVNPAAMSASRRMRKSVAEGKFETVLEEARATLKQALKFGEVHYDKREPIDTSKPGNFGPTKGYVISRWKSDATQAVCTNCGAGFIASSLHMAALHGHGLDHEVIYLTEE